MISWQSSLLLGPTLTSTPHWAKTGRHIVVARDITRLSASAMTTEPKARLPYVELAHPSDPISLSVPIWKIRFLHRGYSRNNNILLQFSVSDAMVTNQQPQRSRHDAALDGRNKVLKAIIDAQQTLSSGVHCQFSKWSQILSCLATRGWGARSCTIQGAAVLWFQGDSVVLCCVKYELCSIHPSSPPPPLPAPTSPINLVDVLIHYKLALERCIPWIRWPPAGAVYPLQGCRWWQFSVICSTYFWATVLNNTSSFRYELNIPETLNSIRR